MSYPKPDGYKGGDDGAAEFIGVTLGTGPSYVKYAKSDDWDSNYDGETRRGAVTLNWQQETTPGC